MYWNGQKQTYFYDMNIQQIRFHILTTTFLLYDEIKNTVMINEQCFDFFVCLEY